MRNQPSADPRDQALAAAMADAAVLGSLVAGEFEASYRGTDRRLYLATLAEFVTDLGGNLQEGSRGAVVSLGDRQIAISFGGR